MALTGFNLVGFDFGLSNTEGTHFFKNKLMFVHVSCTFVSGLILLFWGTLLLWGTLWFSNLHAGLKKKKKGDRLNIVFGNQLPTLSFLMSALMETY